MLSTGLAVTHASGADSIAALTINSANSLNVSGGSLTVSGATMLGGTLTVSGSGTAALNGALNAGSTGVLAVSSGLLNLANTATINTLTQTGGAIAGIGALSVNNSFSQVAGTINLSGPVVITQSTGNLSPGQISSLDKVSLVADSLTLNNTIKAGTVSINPYTANRGVTIGQTACAGGGTNCLSLTNLYHIQAPTISVGGLGSSFAGDIYVAAITQGSATSPAITDIHSSTTRIGLLSNAGVTQGGGIAVQDLGIEAVGPVILNASNNMVSNLAGISTNGGFSFTNAKSLNLTTLAGGLGGGAYSLVGVNTMSAGDISITAPGSTSDITANTLKQDFTAAQAANGHVVLNAGRDILLGNGAVEAGTIGTGGTVNLNAPLGSVFVLAAATGQGGGRISTSAGGLLSVTTKNGMTLTGANQVASFSGSNSTAGDIRLTNTFTPFTINSLSNSNPVGNVVIENTGGIVVAGALTSKGNFAMTAHSPITVNAGGSISAVGTLSLVAGAAGSTAAADTITINGTVAGASVTLGANSVAGSVPANAVITTVAVAPVVTPPVVTTPVVVPPVVTPPVVVPPVVTPPVVMPPVVVPPVVTPPVVTPPVVMPQPVVVPQPVAAEVVTAAVTSFSTTFTEVLSVQVFAAETPVSQIAAAVASETTLVPTATEASATTDPLAEKDAAATEPAAADTTTTTTTTASASTSNEAAATQKKDKSIIVVEGATCTR